MKREELLKLCYFYKGEEECPLEYDGKPEGKFWTAEDSLCNSILLGYDLAPGEAPRQVFDEYMDALLGKWCPYKREELMEIYLNR